MSSDCLSGTLTVPQDSIDGTIQICIVPMVELTVINLLDDQGNIILDDQGNPITITMEAP